MSTSRTPRRLLALALATSLNASALTALADDTSVATLAQARAQADQLMAQGQFVRAQATLMNALSDATGSNDERAEALVALRNIRQKISGADRLEIALQQADMAIAEGNLAFASTRVASVLEAADEGSVLWTRATDARNQIDRRQQALRPMVADALTQAAADLDAGRFAQAKSQLAVVRRAGLDLDAKQGERLSRMELRVADAERKAGTTFDASAAAAASVQAGVVRGRQDGGQQGDPQQLFREAIQQEARANLSQANAAFESGQLAEARRLYVLVRANQDLLTPEERDLVSTRIDEIDVRLSGRPSAQEDIGTTRDLVRQNALAEFRVGVNEAERQLAQGNLGGARAQLSRTRIDFQRNRDVFGQPEFEARINELDDLQARIEAAAIRIQEDQAEALDRGAQEEAAERADRQRNERQRTINLLLDQAREYQMNMRYREALDTIEQLLLIDPINPSGLLLKNAYENILIYVDYSQITERRNKGFAAFRIEAERALIPPLDVVNYPENWPAISQSREAQAEFVDSAENRRVLAQLESSRVQMNLQDNPLESALAFIAQQAEVDFDVEWETLERLGIDRQTPVSLRLASTVNATVALDRLLAKASPDDFNAADWAIIDGLLTVSSAETLLDKTAVGIYDINDLLHEVPDYPDVPEIDLQQALQSSQGGGGQSPFTDQGDGEIEETPLEDRINEIIEIVENNIEEDRGFLEGRWTITPYRGLLIVRATPKAHRQIGGLLDKLRAQQALQLNVETRFLLVNQDYFEQIGFDLDIYFNAKADQFQTAAANDPSLLPSDFFDFSGPNGRRRTVTGGAGPGGTSVVQPVAAPTNTSVIGAGQDSIGLAGALAPTEGIASTILGAAPALGVAGQFLDDVQVDFLVRATQADRRSTQLTAPRLTLTNGQLANIYVATQVAYVGDLEPVVSDSAVGFDPTVEVATEGVTLLVRGTISSDRRYVTMNVDAGLAQIDGFASEQVTAVAGGTLVSSADTQSFIQLPTVTVTRVRTTVTVPDEGTLLLGGQRLVSEFEVETGVPLLSKLPVLNRFFTNRIESKEEQTLLILMKPTVLIQSEQEARNFPAMGGGLNPF
ncbi:Virion export protein (Gene 4 protein) (G4P) [Durusdinium trenchii]|uniref:Virion export protein (Gene 4 protein) (G4P) n=1 Tax=Durusdinium trenchii TaxID=1381693 RepID=A0ABP0KZ03_9DINO